MRRLAGYRRASVRCPDHAGASGADRRFVVANVFIPRRLLSSYGHPAGSCRHRAAMRPSPKRSGAVMGNARPGRGAAMQELATGYGLIEGPVWDAERGLYFSDVLGGGIYLIDRADKVSLVVPKRRGIGGMALHADGGLVAGGRDIVHVSLADQATTVLLDPASANAVGFNDLTTDAKGRIYVGSLAFSVFRDREMKPGHLFLIDLDGRPRAISDGVLLTNGLGFSPDGQRLYHSDARRGLVRVYDVREAGSVAHWRALAATGPGSGPS